MSRYTEPNWIRSALVTIDLQNDNSIPGSIAEVEGTAELLPTIGLIADAFREARRPIIHVIRLYKTDGSNVDLCRREVVENGLQFVVPDTEGANLVKAVSPTNSPNLHGEELLSRKFQQLGEHDWAMYKPRWGAFYQTHLEEFLTDKEIDTLVFTGCNFPNCPRTSIYEASERDFKVVMANDAISGLYEKGVVEMKNIGVTVVTSSEIIHNIKHLSEQVTE
ncbi:cysteine hydrolase [Paenibacillus illinoisensis]|uniref:cysteine hydrolase family protein n=1 Tax=Paenibacillus illinoisensis TaxID=59845 RepID=UPI003CEB9F93